MSRPGSEPSARLRLVQGQSSTRFREFTASDSPSVVLTVGSAPSCDWCVPEPNVAPLAFSLHWDGTSLWAADLHNAGGVWVDEQLLGSEWRRLRIRVRIEFGSAAIVADCSAAGLGNRSTPPPGGAAGGEARDGKTLLSIGAIGVASAAPANAQTDRPNRPSPSQRPRMAKPTIEGYVVQQSQPPAEVTEVRRQTTAVVEETSSRKRVSSRPVPRDPERPARRSSAPAREANGLVVREVAPAGNLQTDSTRYSSSAYPPARAQVVSDDGSTQMPDGVLVLSPPSSRGHRPSSERAPAPTLSQPPPPPAPWSRVGLSVAAIAGAYLLWVYLLSVS